MVKPFGNFHLSYGITILSAFASTFSISVGCAIIVKLNMLKPANIDFFMLNYFLLKIIFNLVSMFPLLIVIVRLCRITDSRIFIISWIICRIFDIYSVIYQFIFFMVNLCYSSYLIRFGYIYKFNTLCSSTHYP